MPRRNRYNRRRRRGNFSLLYRVITFVLICAAIAVALSLFFKVSRISILGNARYSKDEILDASGVSVGDNLYLLNKYQVAENITTTLPYIETVQIQRSLPDALSIIVTECSAPASVAQDGKLYLISGAGKIVNTSNPVSMEKFTTIIGITLIEPEIGKYIKVDNEEQRTLDQLLIILEQLNKKGMLADTQSIDLHDALAIKLRYLDRFDVTFNWDADFDYKLDYLLAVVDRLEINEKGNIDMTQDGKASFIPTI